AASGRGYSPEMAIAWVRRTAFEIPPDRVESDRVGREASPVRQGLFAIVLVAASFAGGAVGNGPGLRWVRDMGLNQRGTAIATTTLSDPSSETESGATSHQDDGVAPAMEIPAAPLPPLVVPPASPDPAPPRVASSEPPRPRAPEPPRSPA